MRIYNPLEDPRITRAINLGGKYWDEKSEIEWERQFSKETSLYNWSEYDGDY